MHPEETHSISLPTWHPVMTAQELIEAIGLEAQAVHSVSARRVTPEVYSWVAASIPSTSRRSSLHMRVIEVSKNTIYLVNATVTFAIFAGCAAVMAVKVAEGEELFFRHYLLGYLGFFSLLLSVLSLVNFLNRRGG